MQINPSAPQTAAPLQFTGLNYDVLSCIVKVTDAKSLLNLSQISQHMRAVCGTSTKLQDIRSLINGTQDINEPLLGGGTPLSKAIDSGDKEYIALLIEHGARLVDCENINKLPKDLHIKGDLDLRGCTALTALPEVLTVGRSLYLSGCTALTAR